ncbi:MAG: hypothetical protein ACJ8AO_08900 [Gemmatimonadaceae bacterium]
MTRARRDAPAALLAAAVALGALAARGGVARTRIAGSREDTLAVARFAAAAREGTTRYRELDAAVADGFRRVGTDFPRMGEHWVSLRRIMADSLAPTEPPILTYVRVRGTPVLAGVAYTALLEPGEALPAFAPALPHWHEHNGGVAEESFPLAHHAGTHGEAPDGPRVAVLHAWVWAANPAGIFAADNPTLPWLRLGAPAPRDPPRGLGEILALVLAGEEYHLLTLRTGAGLSEEESAAAERVLRDYRARALPLVRTPLGPAAERELAELWGALWRELEHAVPQRADAVRRIGAALR